MRIAIPMRPAVLFAILFAVALVLFFPLRLAVGGSGLSAREASGSVWSGSLKEARIGPAVLGDLDARLSPLALLTGRMLLYVARPSAAPDRMVGALGLSRNRRSVESASGLIPIDGAFGALPVASFELTDVTVRFRDGECDRAEGMVRANLSGDGGLNLPASLTAAPRCDRGAVLLPFAVPTGGGAEMRISGDGRWDVRSTGAPPR
ncbi:type II secretion system protein N [Sphingomonas tabacisoli]|uniref:Type II secretion system protein N n=1 Tax=Sphingomonas tabacisoli TaxID=2249466 RepID=A0ABW4I414_9SPHN